MTSKRTTACHGFTLVEAVATMTILAVVSMSASRIIFAAANAYAGDAARAELTLDLSAAMERISTELRSLPCRDASPGTPWIDSAAAGSISFAGDSALSLSGSQLQLTVGGGATRTLLDGVSAFTLAFFDESDQALTLPLSGTGCDSIRRIQITITGTRYGASETLRTRVFVRSAALGGSQ